MARIPDTTLPATFVDGEVLRGWQVNKIITVLKTGVNVNKDDIDKLLMGEKSDFVFANKTLADEYLIENLSVDPAYPALNQYAIVMSGEANADVIEIYKFNNDYTELGAAWDLQVDEVFSIFEAYKVAKDIDNRTTTLENEMNVAQANIDDIIDGTTIVSEATKATNDSENNPINTTYLKKTGGTMLGTIDMMGYKIQLVGLGVNAGDAVNKSQLDTKLNLSGGTMSGNIAMGTKKITGLGDGVDAKDAANLDNVDAKIETHNEAIAGNHLDIRELIDDLEREISRLDARGKSFGEIAYKNSDLIAMEDDAARALAIKNDIEARAIVTTYTPLIHDLIYTANADGENTYEWEYNGTIWVNNGQWTIDKATNDEYGTVKGDGIYVSIVNSIMQILKADYADKVGTSDGSYTYAQLYNALADRYTKAETDALLDALKSAFGWEQSELYNQTITTGIDVGFEYITTLAYSTLDDYEFALITFIYANKYMTQLVRVPSTIADNTVLYKYIEGAGYIQAKIVLDTVQKLEITSNYTIAVGSPLIVKVDGIKIKPIDAGLVAFDGTGTNYVSAETDVEGAIIALDNAEKLVKDSLDVVVEETRDVGTTEISFENGKVVAITSDNCTTNLLYGANGNIQKITETYADGKSYETTYTKDVEGRIKTMTKVEV